ncbi:MAG: hypothetical protein COA99_17385 [Moraxellaceae bacterium]|nr:MAG: hypothetical protein COA99_17385 [Moraxellaceae bacterium]
MSISIDKVADALSEEGYIVIPYALDDDVLHGLQQRVTRLSSEQWLRAGVGRNTDYQQNKKIRSDSIFWISKDDPQELAFLQEMEVLRVKDEKDRKEAERKERYQRGKRKPQ